MRNDPFQYVFRFCCDPDFNDRQEIDALMDYVDDAVVDDVAIFANVEEINTGHMSFQEQDRYIALMREVRDLLKEKGVTISVNQWHSVMHADLGKSFRPDQPFRPMVDIEGNEASLSVCPLCENWQAYIGKLYARYAELEPSILWVEDDFRLHNHDPLVWGGCFCPEHMKRYSALAGKELTREEFLAGVLQPGEPHPYRKIWLDVARETMLSAARAISTAVREVTSQSRVGLMSSVPFVHAAEGRDWHAILNTLAGGQTPVNRIHLPGYQESAPSHYLRNLNMVSMLNRAMIPENTQVYPELENFPYSLFSKSRRFTRFQLVSGLPLNLAGITIDLYDLNGNGIIWEEGYQDMLREVKPYLNTLTASGVFRGKREGVKVLYSQRSSYTLHTTEGKHMEELYPHDCFWAGILPAMGVPYAYTDSANHTGEILAASGQVLRNFSAAELEAMFANNFVILNGDAAWTLFDMGLGHLAGIAGAKWIKQNDGTYAFEQVTNGRIYRGREKARASAIISASDALDITYLENAQVEEYTALFDSFRKPRLSCETVVNGRVMIFPFGRFDYPLSIPPMFWNGLRQELLQEILCKAGASFPMVKNMPYLEPHYLVKDGEEFLYLVNGSTDEAVNPELLHTCLDSETEIQLSTEQGSVSVVQTPATENGNVLQMHIPSMEALLLKLKK